MNKPMTKQEVMQLKMTQLQDKIKRLTVEKPTEPQAVALARAKSSLAELQNAIRKVGETKAS